MSTNIIDPHVHFFNLLDGQYTWLQGSNPPAWPNLEKIKRPISAQQLANSTDFKLKGLVHIEAGFDNSAPIRELNWLSKHLSEMPFKAISFNQIDAPAEQFSNALNALAHSSLCGIRDITEGDDALRLKSPRCIHNLDLLAANKLHFEAQFELHNISVANHIAHCAKQLPHLQIILNHAGLPDDLISWQKGVELLAQYSNIAIKFSGFELLDLTQSQQEACFKWLLKHFGEQRIMFASNFPVCQINTYYNALWHQHYALCNSHSLWLKLSYANAKHYYQV